MKSAFADIALALSRVELSILVKATLDNSQRRGPTGLRTGATVMCFNTGGDLTVGTPLIKAAAEKAAGIKVFVFTGRATFSAGITHVVQLKQWTGATIVGEPVGDELDTWSEVLCPKSTFLPAPPPDVRRGYASPFSDRNQKGLCPSYGLWPMNVGQSPNQGPSPGFC